MAAKKVDPASGVSTRNNLAAGSGNKKQGFSLPEPPPRDTPPAQNSAAGYIQSFRGENLAELELHAMLNALRDNNGSIREAADLLSSRQSEMSTVPSVLGYTVPAAASRLGEAGLRIGKITRESRFNVPIGHVIGQEPSPGVSVEAGSGVRLIISGGLLYGEVNSSNK